MVRRRATAHWRTTAGWVVQGPAWPANGDCDAGARAAGTLDRNREDGATGGSGQSVDVECTTPPEQGEGVLRALSRNVAVVQSYCA